MAGKTDTKPTTIGSLAQGVVYGMGIIAIVVVGFMWWMGQECKRDPSQCM